MDHRNIGGYPVPMGMRKGPPEALGPSGGHSAPEQATATQGPRKKSGSSKKQVASAKALESGKKKQSSKNASTAASDRKSGLGSSNPNQGEQQVKYFRGSCSSYLNVVFMSSHSITCFL